jgi:hypothetical protein
MPTFRHVAVSALTARFSSVSHVPYDGTCALNAADAHQHVELVAVVHIGTGSPCFKGGIAGVSAAPVVAGGTNVVEGRMLLRRGSGSNVCRIGVFNRSAQKCLFVIFRQIVSVPVRVVAGNATCCLVTDRHISHQSIVSEVVNVSVNFIPRFADGKFPINLLSPEGSAVASVANSHIEARV